MTSEKTVLIADDDELVRATFKLCFEKAGYRVLEARDGHGALELLKANSVGTLLLDVYMPDKDGLETLLEVKKRLPETRIVVMTGGGVGTRYDFLDAALMFGADAVVRKPVSPMDVIAMIENGSLFRRADEPPLFRDTR